MTSDSRPVISLSKGEFHQAPRQADKCPPAENPITQTELIFQSDFLHLMNAIA